MLVRRFALLLAALVTAPVLAPGAAAQPTLTSEHLAEPDLLVDVLRTNADFWMGDAWDQARGGFYTNVNRSGSVITAWGTNKNVLTQSRDAFAFVRAFQLTGDEAYLDAARSALDFQYAHGWDPVHGGWFDRLSQTGTPENPNVNKSAFLQHYALLGPLAMAEATDDPRDWQRVRDGVAWNEAHLWDDQPGQEGYYDRAARSGSIGTGKSFNATVDALTTHAFALYALTGEAAHRERIAALADNVEDHLVASMPDQAIGFAEAYSSGWTVLSGSPEHRRTIMGHVLKTAWVMGRAYEVMGDPADLATAERLADHVLARGYDHDFGGPYKDYDRTTGQMLLYGLADSTKAWWQMEQAVTAGLELYRQTQAPRWLEMADETMAFFMDHFQDPVHGEVYADRTRRGDGVPQWGEHKGDGFKAAYHSAELATLAHLYATLYVHGRPATVYYRFEPAAEARTLVLSPLDAGPGRLRLSAVLRDGQPHAAYDPIARTLTLAPGEGGLVAATFTTGAPTSQADAPEGRLFRLAAPAPNPARGRVRLRYSLPTAADVRLTVHDALGRAVLRVAEGPRSAGDGSEMADVSGLAAGVYVVRLEAGGEALTQRLSVVR